MSFDLYVDTSRKGVSIAIAGHSGDASCNTNSGDADSALYCEIVDPDAKGETLSTGLDRLLEQSGITLEQIKRVMVTLGPGSFSGLRTGVAFCQGICFSGARDLYGVSTLEALECFAAGTSAETTATAAVVAKARNGYWYLRLAGAESFDSTEEVLAKLKGNLPKSVVLDKAAGEDSSLCEFFTTNGIETLQGEGKPLNLWAPLFQKHKPSLIQEANYIQPSYFEKGH
jgi:tRNA threonylcarbamoyladenosine biosynthesis protein TsaB